MEGDVLVVLECTVYPLLLATVSRIRASVTILRLSSLDLALLLGGQDTRPSHHWVVGTSLAPRLTLRYWVQFSLSFVAISG